MRYRHRLRGLGADHQTRISVNDPSLVCTDSRLFRGAVMVEDAHQTIDGNTTKGVHIAGSAASHKDVNALVLGPHGRNPRLADV